MSGPFLLVSSHDFRTPRKANMHFIARELRRRGAVRFFSAGFSHLSRLKSDPRSSLWGRTNRIERVDGVDCFLWRTPLHPVRWRAPAMSWCERKLFEVYASRVPQAFVAWVRESRIVFLESGFPVALFRSVKRLNPAARVVYVASDDLATIECAPFLQEELRATAGEYDLICLPSRQLAAGLPAGCRTAHVPHGLDRQALSVRDPSPYPPGVHAVSVGSMLFDPWVFDTAAASFPDITFHIIGGGPRAAALARSNVIVHGEMPFAETVPHLAHARFGIAPYRGEKVAPYMADTSMKLMQFAALGIPAVCPVAVTGGRPERFGYEPGNGASLVAAIRAACGAGRLPPRAALSWDDVVDRLLVPDSYSDARM
ncbi:MAG: UDP-glucuronate--glycolipid 2-beta-glucuronosyltransferase [Bradyrhizobiaceae bacterium]|nr:MAG: UDP-glucuronate--glycolipid 2-beta-glucuronosyltransferase [Bradyrhizobiaceae bacterium]